MNLNNKPSRIARSIRANDQEWESIKTISDQIKRGETPLNLFVNSVRPYLIKECRNSNVSYNISGVTTVNLELLPDICENLKGLNLQNAISICERQAAMKYPILGAGAINSTQYIDLRENILQIEGNLAVIEAFRDIYIKAAIHN